MSLKILVVILLRSNFNHLYAWVATCTCNLSKSFLLKISTIYVTITVNKGYKCMIYALLRNNLVVTDFFVSYN